MDKRKKPFIHGTVGGHTRHRRLNEKPCEECRAAFNEYNKSYKIANPEKTKEYAKTTYKRLLADPERLAARKEYNKQFRKPYDYQANKEYQKWYYENVRKLKK
jgi:hypothetical protein